MVQKYQSPVRIYKYPFELVMAAYERRFPTCPLIPVFIGSEIINEYRSNDEAVHIVERRCKLNVDIPYLLKKIIGVDYAFFIQKNSLDRRQRTLRIEAHNESFSSRVVVIENCIYYVHPENPDWTCFEQSGSLDIKSFFGFESTVEKLAVKQYSQNIAKGKEIIEHFVAELRQEGITHIPPFQEGNGSTEGICNGNVKMTEEFRERSTSDNSEGSEELHLGATAASIQQLTLSTEENQFQLEAEYIERTLGHLTPLQESRLLQLRKCVGELHKGKIPSDGMLLRFLRAREFNVDKAREMLCQSLIWRKKHQIDRLLAEYQSPPVVKDYFSGGWHHTDKDGRPLYLLRLGQLDVKGLIKSISEEGLLKLALHVCEEGLRRCEKATKSLGRPIQTWTLLVDLDGLTMRHLWRPGIQTLLRITEVVEANYPETLGRVLVTRAPRVFPILWTVISTFIDEITRSKILFHVGTDWHVSGGLADMILDDNIPDFLGGPAKTVLPDGGLIPKSLYMAEDHFERERSVESPTLCEDNIYRCVTLLKGQVHEVVINNEDLGSVICWDFDVMRHDVMFNVFRSKSTILKPAGLAASSGPLDKIQTMNPLAERSEDHRSVIEKTWKEGIDYWVVEPGMICHDGESIQGSHVTTHTGSYVLQWRLNEACATGGTHLTLPNPRDFIDSFTAHGPKAKLMYFYEILRSDDYKGSMTSLQSGHSGFSSLSQQTSASGTSSAISR